MLEFGQPLALFGVLATVLPILAHLAYRRISQKKLFSSLRFLSPSTIPRSGKRRPSDWPLLLIRILLILAITAFLADPYWRDAEFSDLSSASREIHFHLLDCSMSMSGWGAWEEARSVLIKHWSDPKIDHALIASDENGSKFWQAGTPRDELLKAFDSLSPVFGQARVSSLLQNLRKLWGPGKKTAKIFIYSDFQTSDWQDVDAAIAALGAELVLVPLGHGETPWQTRKANRALVDARVVPSGPGKLRIWAVVRNWDINRSTAVLSLRAGGKLIEQVEVSLPSNGVEQAQFSVPAGDFVSATLALEGEDGCAWDNYRSLWLMPPPARGFAIAQRSSPDPSDDTERDFLKAVMESVGDGVWNRWEEMSTDSSIECLLIPGLSDWAVQDDTLPRLKTHLDGGGVALVTPGESPVGMNQILRESGLMKFTYSRLAQTDLRMDPYRIEVLDKDHSLASVFLGASARDLYLAKFNKFLVLRQWQDDADCPVYDREGRPLALIRKFSGGGRLVLLTFRLLPEWTDLPTRNSFLPLLVELCALGPGQTNDRSVKILHPGEQFALDGAVFTAKEPGLFRHREERIEVQANLAESSPEVMNQEEMTEALLGSVGLLQSSPRVEAEESGNPNQGTPLWMWFALVAGVLLIAEMILSLPRSTNPVSSIPENA